MTMVSGHWYHDRMRNFGSVETAQEAAEKHLQHFGIEKLRVVERIPGGWAVRWSQDVAGQPNG